MKYNIAYIFCLIILLASSSLMFISGCSGVSARLDKIDGNPVYQIGKVGLHLTIKAKAAELMDDYLLKNPESIDRLPQLSLAWDYFWTGRNPFDRDSFDLWLSAQADKLGASQVERASLESAARLLWVYLEIEDDGYVYPSPRTRRIVDSLVAGLRTGYRQHVVRLSAR